MSEMFKGSLLLAATLSAGIAIGFWYGHSGRQAAAVSHPEPANVSHAHVMHTLDQALKLDSTQHAAIMETLHRNQALVDSAWMTMRPHVNARLVSAHEEIMRLLTPGQRAAFERMAKDHHRGH